MRARQPLNQQAVRAPVPQATGPVNATHKVPVPDQLRQAAMENSAGLVGRAAKIAALEAAANPNVVEGATTPQAMPARPEEVAVIGGRQPDEPAPPPVQQIIDQPPAAGLNPRYKPPSR